MAEKATKEWANKKIEKDRKKKGKRAEIEEDIGEEASDQATSENEDFIIVDVE